MENSTVHHVVMLPAEAARRVGFTERCFVSVEGRGFRSRVVLLVRELLFVCLPLTVAERCMIDQVAVMNRIAPHCVYSAAVAMCTVHAADCCGCLIYTVRSAAFAAMARCCGRICGRGIAHSEQSMATAEGDPLDHCEGGSGAA